MIAIENNNMIVGMYFVSHLHFLPIATAATWWNASIIRLKFGPNWRGTSIGSSTPLPTDIHTKHLSLLSFEIHMIGSRPCSMCRIMHPHTLNTDPMNDGWIFWALHGQWSALEQTRSTIHVDAKNTLSTRISSRARRSRFPAAPTKNWIIACTSPFMKWEMMEPADHTTMSWKWGRTRFETFWASKIILALRTFGPCSTNTYWPKEHKSSSTKLRDGLEFNPTVQLDRHSSGGTDPWNERWQIIFENISTGQSKAGLDMVLTPTNINIERSFKALFVVLAVHWW